MRFDASGSVDMPEGKPLAKVVNGELWLWPQGVGHGICLVMTLAEWRRLRDSANGAITAAGLDWSAYLATEGNGGEL